MMADFYECSQKRFKQDYGKPSERTCSAMSEAEEVSETRYKIFMYNESNVSRGYYLKQYCLTSQGQSNKMEEDQKFDTSFLIDSRYGTILGVLSNVRQPLHCNRKLIYSPGREQLWSCHTLQELSELVEKTGLSILLRLLKDETDLLCLSEDILPHVPVQLSALSFFSEYVTPPPGRYEII